MMNRPLLAVLLCSSFVSLVGVADATAQHTRRPIERDFKRAQRQAVIRHEPVRPVFREPPRHTLYTGLGSNAGFQPKRKGPKR